MLDLDGELRLVMFRKDLLNFRYLVVVFYRLDDPLKRRLETLKELNMGRYFAGYSDVLPLNIVSSESFT
jgi:hypothetical protein